MIYTETLRTERRFDRFDVTGGCVYICMQSINAFGADIAGTWIMVDGVELHIADTIENVIKRIQAEPTVPNS